METYSLIVNYLFSGVKNVSKMSQFKWTRRRERAVLALAQGYTVEQAAEQAKVNRRTVTRWKNNLEFSVEVDRLSLLVGVACRAERLRIAMRVVREKIDGEKVETGKDLLDWLKFTQSETDGAKLDLAALFEAMETTAGDNDNTGPEGSGETGKAGGTEEEGIHAIASSGLS